MGAFRAPLALRFFVPYCGQWFGGSGSCGFTEQGALEPRLEFPVAAVSAGAQPIIMPNSETELIEKAKRYLKQSYGEDTVALTVTKNAVVAGNGTLAVDCTVSVGGSRSDWSKVFHFTNGLITDMDYRRR
jgi:hypothetical protein